MSTPKVFARAFLTADLTKGADNANAEFQGRWRINAGSEMQVTIPGLNNGEPIRLVVDLATVRAKNNRVVALFDHSPANAIGYWDDFSFTAEGAYANLHLVAPQDEKEEAVFADLVRTRALIRSKVPIQVSIGADAGEKGEWKRIEGKITLNGREYDGGGSVPLYVLYNGEIFESSMVTFGADDMTGRLAATKQTTPPIKGVLMSDLLKALLGKYPDKHHGLIARCVAEGSDETTIATKVHAADDAEKDKEIEALKAKCAELQAKCDDYAQKGQEKQEKETAEKVAAAAKGKGSDKAVSFHATDDTKKKDDEAQPQTLSQAMKVMAAADPALKGFALRKAARAKYPNVSEK